jgi:hypothetical protein
VSFDATWCGRASIDARSAFVTGELLLLHPSVRSETAAASYVLGVLLHFFIALSFAAFYYAASRRLTFLTEHPPVCGLFYGAAVEQVMNLLVLPLSALHARGPPISFMN